VIGSVRHAAICELRKARRKATHTTDSRPPWPGWGGRLRWWAAARKPGLGQIVILAACIAMFTVLSLAASAGCGLSEATTSSLAVLWQVQATSVGLVLALVVFVFGLLPQGRGRLTYREFLNRTWALPLTTLNVASLLFNGMVLLGTGHQVPATSTTPGHGWAVTVASIIALASTGTIVVILARAVRAISPQTEADVQRKYRQTAVALAARAELIEYEAVRLMNAATGPYTFSPAYPGPGLTTRVTSQGEWVVHDVPVWRLHLLKLAGKRPRHGKPAVHVWPGRPARQGTPLITVGAPASLAERLLSRVSLRVRPAPPNLLQGALMALHGETVEHIRAGRHAEAADGIQALGSLRDVVRQAWSAHGRPGGADTPGPLVIYRRTAGERIELLLEDLLRAAAISTDEAIQKEASDQPRADARDALYRGDQGAASRAGRQLAGVYLAVAGDLSDGGRRDLPSTGLARSRLHAPFRSLLSFVHSYLAPAIDQAAAGSTLSWDGQPLPPLEYLFSQLRATGEAMLEMLRTAILMHDGLTVEAVLRAWRMPDLPLAQAARQQPAGVATPDDGLAQLLDDAAADLEAMIFRLLVAATGAGRSEDADPAADIAADAILDRLPSGQLLTVLDRAIQTSDGDWRWQWPDDAITPAGMVTVAPVDTISPLLEAFALAAIARPALARGSADPQVMLDRGPALITAVRQALSSRQPWLERHGCAEPAAARNADELIAWIEAAQADAQRELQERIRQSPLRPGAEPELRRAAQAAFSDTDLTGTLFTWAGKLVADPGLPTLEVSIELPRSMFTSPAENEQVMVMPGQRLGRQLALTSLEKLITEAVQAGIRLDVDRAGLAATTRAAITALSGVASAQNGQLPQARIAVLVPDIPYDIRRDLGITAARDPGQEDAWRQAVNDLALTSESLAALVAGTFEDAPVIVTGILDSHVVVIDLARFGELHREARGSQLSAPELTLIEPADPLRPVGSVTAPLGPAGNVGTSDLLQVTVKLSLPTKITINDTSAVKVLKIR
jgi:hypothetical protein